MQRPSSGFRHRVQVDAEMTGRRKMADYIKRAKVSTNQTYGKGRGNR
jgi:hypothetical protein